MSLERLSAPEVLAQWARFDTRIDARSPLEFALDHLPGAENWPTLNDAERAMVGTLYVQGSPFEAKKRGAALAARNIAAHIDAQVLSKPKDWKPLAYCWRGGKRSGSLALVLDQIGFRVTLLDGGYKAFRAAMLQDLAQRVGQIAWRVVCGTTGSGKTRLLQALRTVGAQVLDLEALANHRSSVLGALPGQPQPTQKRFDTLVWDAVRQFDPLLPVYVESESKKVGNVSIDVSLLHAMRAGSCIDLVLPFAERVELLMEDYAFFAEKPELLCERLDLLTDLRGHTVVNGWKALIAAGQVRAVVQDLLSQHYDPGYTQSIGRNFAQYAVAQRLTPRDRSLEAMEEAAAQLVGAASIAAGG